MALAPLTLTALGACGGGTHTVAPATSTIASTTTTLPPSTTTLAPTTTATTTTTTTLAPTTTATTHPPTTTAATTTTLRRIRRRTTTTTTPTPTVTVPPSGGVVSGRVTAIGDSVMLGAKGALTARGIRVYAQVSFQFRAAAVLIQSLRANGALGSIVVIHLGTNGPFSGASCDTTMHELVGVRVFFMDVKLPKSWEAASNASIASCAGRYGAPVIDWRGYSIGHPDWFYSDGIHLRPAGAAAYASLVVSRV